MRARGRPASTPPRGGDWQRPAARRLNAQVELQLPRCRTAAFSASSSASSCADPRCSSDRAAVIVGAGPTELMLAGELAPAGVDVVIVER